jgi:hypothetical protein
MKLKNILKAAICAFGQNTFDSFSLEEEEFIRALDYYITEKNNYEEMFEEYAYELEYNTEDIENICDNCKYKNKDWDYLNIIANCRLAYIQTITKDKTIDAEAFVDNIVKEFNKISK